MLSYLTNVVMLMVQNYVKINDFCLNQSTAQVLTWCNSRSLWAGGAAGLIRSMRLIQCLSPCWTGGGTLHSYQCRTKVKGNEKLITEAYIRKHMWQLPIVVLQQHHLCIWMTINIWTCFSVQYLFLFIYCYFSQVHNSSFPTGIVVHTQTEMRFLSSVLSRGS